MRPRRSLTQEAGQIGGQVCGGSAPVRAGGEVGQESSLRLVSVLCEKLGLSVDAVLTEEGFGPSILLLALWVEEGMDDEAKLFLLGLVDELLDSVTGL